VIILHENPLGREAAGILIKANASDVVKHIDLSGATLTAAALRQGVDGSGGGDEGRGAPGPLESFDPRCPSRVYRLDLSNAGHREVVRIPRLLRANQSIAIRVASPIFLLASLECVALTSLHSRLPMPSDRHGFAGCEEARRSEHLAQGHSQWIALGDVRRRVRRVDAKPREGRQSSRE